LFYRLHVVPITMPALRERRSDIPLLVHHVLDRKNSKRRGRPVSVSADAMVHLREYDWPGNVRELENLLERLVILADESVIRASHLPPALRALVPERRMTRITLGETGLDLDAAVQEFEHGLIAEALRRTKGNKQAAARLLGLKRTTLVAKLRRRAEGSGAAVTARAPTDAPGRLTPPPGCRPVADGPGPQPVPRPQIVPPDGPRTRPGPAPARTAGAVSPGPFIAVRRTSGRARQQVDIIRMWAASPRGSGIATAALL